MLVQNISHENDLICKRMNVQVTCVFIQMVCHRGKTPLLIHELAQRAFDSFTNAIGKGNLNFHLRFSLSYYIENEIKTSFVFCFPMTWYNRCNCHFRFTYSIFAKTLNRKREIEIRFSFFVFVFYYISSRQ